MSSHDTQGHFIVAYHLDGKVVGVGADYDARLRYCANLNAEDQAGGRWAVHELGPEVKS